MQVDLIAGSRYRALPSHLAESMRPTILVFDSGLGGLTVFAEVLRARPDAQLVYAADDAGFPYGRDQWISAWATAYAATAMAYAL